MISGLEEITSKLDFNNAISNLRRNISVAASKVS